MKKDEKLCLNRKKGERLHNWGKRGGSWSTEERVRCGWGGRWRGGGRKGGAVKWHSWQMTSPVSQSPLLSTMICHLHFWHFSSHYQITLTEWYFLILPALEHTKNNGLHMLSALVLFPCFTLHFLSRVWRKYPVIFFFLFFFFQSWICGFGNTLLVGPWKQSLSQHQLNCLVHEEHNLVSLPTHQIGERSETQLLRQSRLRVHLLLRCWNIKCHKFMTACMSQWLSLF